MSYFLSHYPWYDLLVCPYSSPALSYVYNIITQDQLESMEDLHYQVLSQITTPAQVIYANELVCLEWCADNLNGYTYISIIIGKDGQWKALMVTNSIREAQKHKIAKSPAPTLQDLINQLEAFESLGLILPPDLQFNTNWFTVYPPAPMEG